jgi:Asp-tRNA(Asn)/Glu-tRNA(Gln) amidotransferase A subunit family amidase
MDNLHSLTISTALGYLQEQKISTQDLVESCSHQIERLNPQLCAFITVIAPQDAIEAQLREQPFASKSLRGIPIALKTSSIRRGSTSRLNIRGEYSPGGRVCCRKLKQAAPSSWENEHA